MPDWINNPCLLMFLSLANIKYCYIRHKGLLNKKGCNYWLHATETKGCRQYNRISHSAKYPKRRHSCYNTQQVILIIYTNKMPKGAFYKEYHSESIKYIYIMNNRFWVVYNYPYQCTSMTSSKRLLSKLSEKIVSLCI